MYNTYPRAPTQAIMSLISPRYLLALHARKEVSSNG